MIFLQVSVWYFNFFFFLFGQLECLYSLAFYDHFWEILIV